MKSEYYINFTFINGIETFSLLIKIFLIVILSYPQAVFIGADNNSDLLFFNYTFLDNTFYFWSISEDTSYRVPYLKKKLKL